MARTEAVVITGIGAEPDIILACSVCGPLGSGTDDWARQHLIEVHNADAVVKQEGQS